MPKRTPFVIVVALAVAASASTWFYMNRILRAQQVADAEAHNRPRGNLSDLYPRWLGAREILLHRRNPYTAEITREIQQGYYGRPLDPSRQDDPKDQQGFAYPVYVVFLLAPIVGLPYHEVQMGYWWLLVALAPLTILVWLRILQWKAGPGRAWVFIILMLGWIPMVQGIKLQQLSLLVAGLVAVSLGCCTRGWLFSGGALMAVATIKPQLVWPTILWLMVWTVSDWRARRRFVFGFALVMALLLVGAELLLPGWLPMFVEALAQYHQYVQNQSVLSCLFGILAGRILGVFCVLACAGCLWRLRREPPSSPAFGRACAVVLALTVVIVPMAALYNQVLLAPAILALVRSGSRRAPVLTSFRMARAIGVILLVWPWVATIGLTTGYPWLTPELRQRIWLLPFYSTLMLPLFVFGLALAEMRMNPAPGLRDNATAE